MNLTEYEKEVYREQLRHSAQRIEELQHDASPEGTAEFHRHAAIIKEIRARFHIAQESLESIEALKDILSRI